MTPKPQWEEEHEKLWTIGSIGEQIRFGRFSTAKQIEFEFIKDIIAQAKFESYQQGVEDMRRKCVDAVIEHTEMDLKTTL